MTVTYRNAKQVVDTNYGGVKNVTEPLLPTLRAFPAGARVVNVTSRGGLYEIHDVISYSNIYKILSNKIICLQSMMAGSIG